MPVIMEKTLQVINRLVEDGIIVNYAIGGGVAATYYGEPTRTYDLDMFVHFKGDLHDLAVLSPVYKYLKSLGYKSEGEIVNIEGMFVQFLPAYNDLVAEAIDGAATVFFEKTETRVFTLEHLMAIMIQTGRSKDKTRIANLLELINAPGSDLKLNKRKLNDILKRHGLKEQWDDFIG